MKTLTMLVGMLCMVAMLAGCAGGIERTNGTPIKAQIKDSPGASIYVNLNARDQSGDMPKTVSTVPTVSAAASESGTASTDATPNANVTNQPAAK